MAAMHAMDARMNLDINDPGKVADILHYTAQAYYDAESELSSEWPGAGKVWGQIARVLERAAASIEEL